MGASGNGSLLLRVYLLGQQVSEVLADDFCVLVGLAEFVFKTLINLVDDFAMHDQFGGALLVPLFQVLKVLCFALHAQFTHDLDFLFLLR